MSEDKINAKPHGGPAAFTKTSSFSMLIDDLKSIITPPTPPQWSFPPTKQWQAINTAYSLLKIDPAKDINGDLLLDRVANLVHQSKHAHTGHDLSEKNKALAAENAELTDKLNKAYGAIRVLQASLSQTEEATNHPLFKIYALAIDQLENGKGEERHGQGKPFMKQPWRRLGDVYGTGFLFGQADKKLEEAQGLSIPEHRRKELLGALNYIAMGLLHDAMTNNPAEDE